MTGEYIKAFLIGIIQGITEWLPVSSTGHMILLEKLINFGVSDDFFELFLVMVQLGSVFAVISTYFSDLNPLSPSKTKSERRGIYLTWAKIILGVTPAALIGFIFEDVIYNVFFNPTVVAIALFAYGVIFILLERGRKKKSFEGEEDITFIRAFGIGCFQVLSLIPGTSRSGSTIIGAMILGNSRESATRFSFFMAVPVMLGASALKLAGLGRGFDGEELIVLLIGMVSAFIVSVFSIKFLVGYVKKHSLALFGWYRIIFGAAVFAIAIMSS